LSAKAGEAASRAKRETATTDEYFFIAFSINIKAGTVYRPGVRALLPLYFETQHIQSRSGMWLLLLLRHAAKTVATLR
jgi:hypothetical protein